MTLILGFDTSAAYVGAALLDGIDVVAAKHAEMARGQAERLFPMLEEVLTEAGKNWSDLDAIGVGTGPGNFTGIRLSVAAARGLSLSLGIPAVGIPLLDAAALGTPGPVLSCLHAPRAQAYVMSRDTRTAVPAQLIEIASMPDNWADPALTCVGSAANDVAAKLGATVAPPRFAPASAIARLAATRWKDAPARPAPLYLKPADAAPARDGPPVMLDDA